ncbi:response regulator transcription factor [Hymenobacter sp. ASUV-10]|uniref:Response regulator transcription factor n=1 Tax=Hymenobacter aranciens TaxID=3063996 RepID=A0ABT9BGA0_9BACT|nr:response regulator transcription factor [Hymenobacter sp. ASUV-10]MDO7875681.1 response regulator transcription factor [Hymenobacter sp. ASUV-10]
MLPPTPPVVLLVENDPVWATLLADVLRQEGATVLGPAATAAEARALCAAAHPAPTLAVLDIGLDGPEDGLALGRWLHQQRGLPLLYCTALDDAARFHEARLTTPLAFVRKSSAPTELRCQLVLAFDYARRFPPPAPALTARLLLPEATGHHHVSVADLLYAEARGRSRVLATASSEYVVHQPLCSLLEELQPYGFVQVHRSFLLNPAHPWHLDSERTSMHLGKATVLLGEQYRDALLRSLPVLR